MECFHACEQSGGKTNVQRNAPFKSNNSEKAWLGIGYYFWLGRKCLAESWGRKSIKGPYAIIRVELDGFDKNRDFLDLVGCPQAIAYFKELYEDFVQHLNQGGDEAIPTVSACINYYRKLEQEKEGTFPFKLVRATDQKSSIKQNIQFIEDDKKKHTIALNDRHQICVFEEGLEFIFNKSIVHPENWKD